MVDALDLERLIVLLREDNAGRQSCSARFERSTEGGAGVLIELLEDAVGVAAVHDGGDQIVRVTFPPELLVAVARVAHAAGGAYLVPGLDRRPRQR